MTKKRVFALLPLLLAAVFLAACGPSEAENSAAVLTQAAQIFSDSLTQTAAVAPPTATATTMPPTATNTPLPPTNTPTVTGTPPTATASPTQQQQTSGGGSGGNKPGCLRAELGYETIPDGAKIEVGLSFKKIWTFKNIGTCTWTQAFSLVWQQGEAFGTKGTIGFEDFTDVEIPPGEHLTVEVTMLAPGKEGIYKGYWLLRSDGGLLFGLGPDGTAWFWTEISAED